MTMPLRQFLEAIATSQKTIRGFVLVVFLALSVNAHGLDNFGDDKAEVDITQAIVAYEIINVAEITESDTELQQKIFQIICDTEEDKGKQIILARDTIRFFAENTTDEHKKTSTRILMILTNLMERLKAIN